MTKILKKDIVRLCNCIRNGVYITCSMYDELKEME